MVIWFLQQNKHFIGPKIASSFLIALKCTLFWNRQVKKKIQNQGTAEFTKKI